ncbi:hypothetical protein A1F97_02352, partial [Pyrenophora tritici-repentis]
MAPQPPAAACMLRDTKPTSEAVKNDTGHHQTINPKIPQQPILSDEVLARIKEGPSWDKSKSKPPSWILKD